MKHRAPTITNAADPQGRIDMLASGLLAKAAAQNPFVKALHEEFRPEIDDMLSEIMGPGNRQTRQVTTGVKRLARAVKNGRPRA